jgi:death-on-curing protein
MREEPVNPGELINTDSLSSAAARPFTMAGGTEQFCTVHEKAAALFHSLIANHPFTNGNKRTAVLSAEMFYCANAHLLIFVDPEDTFVKLAVKTASYRELDISHDAMFAEIVDTFSRFSGEINDELREANPTVHASFSEVQRQLLSRGIPGWIFSN